MSILVLVSRLRIFVLVHLLGSPQFLADAFSVPNKPSGPKKISTTKHERNSGGCSSVDRKSPAVSSRVHTITVHGLPVWLPTNRLLGKGSWKQQHPESNLERRSSSEDDAGACTGVAMRASLPLAEACALAARLRGVGIGGHLLKFDALPPLPRAAVRAARTEDARARRNTSPGFAKSGVKLDAEGKWSLTPEKLATGIASRFPPGTRIVDTTCGAGGNSIAFARSGCNVVAIERDATRLAMAKHNAKVYGVASRIDFRCGDCLALLPHLTRGQEGDEKAAAIDVLFVDPPWGEHWNRTRTTLSDLPLLDKLVQRLTTTTSTCADVAVAGGSIDYKALGDSSEEKANAKKKTESPRFKRLLAKVPPSFDPSAIPGSQVEAMFGHQEGDYHRVKFLLLGVDLVRDL